MWALWPILAGMNKVAYEHGSQVAILTFLKLAGEDRAIWPAMLSAVPAPLPLGPIAAAVTAPEGKRLAGAAGSALGSVGGGVLGALAANALGGALTHDASTRFALSLLGLVGGGALGSGWGYRAAVGPRKRG
jgi:hypothetical protein